MYFCYYIFMRNNEIKAIFVDLDWTLLNHYVGDWDYVSIQALKKAQENGIKVIVATARPYGSVKAQRLFEFFTPDAVVCTNGAVAIINGKCVFSMNIPNEYVRKTIEITKRYGLDIEVNYELDRFSTLPPNEFVSEYMKTYAEVVPPIKEYENENVSAILIWANKDYDERLINELPQDFLYKRFHPFGVDLCYYDVKKSIGLDIIMKHYGLSKDNCIAIGDDIYDAQMFDCSKYKVAMGNADKSLKEQATYITKSCNENGVMYALQYYKVI